MPTSTPTLMTLVRAIAAGEVADARRLLPGSPELATERIASGATRQQSSDYFLEQIGHYVYTGDTALHIAAAAYQADLARSLVELGADVAARNRQGAPPLHYAADGAPGRSHW